MGDLHAMVIEDEIVLCGVLLALGIATGAIARFLNSLRQRKAARAGSV